MHTLCMCDIASHIQYIYQRDTYSDFILRRIWTFVQVESLVAYYITNSDKCYIRTVRRFKMSIQ
jgi:hypothetical protein